jgi:hypothetical protein
MSRLIRRLAGVIAVSGMVGFGSYAMAQNTTVQDGLINVTVGDITVRDVNVGVAAGIAANACGLKVGPIAVLGRAVDRSGQSTTVCTTPQTVTLSQN